MFLWSWLLLLLFFIHCFLASSLTLAWVITRFLHPFSTFRLDHRRVIRDAFILTFLGPFATVLSRVLRFWEDVFYPQAFFILRFFPTFLAQPTFQGLPRIGQFFLEVCRASCWSTKHRPGPSVCLSHNKIYNCLATWSVCLLPDWNSFRDSSPFPNNHASSVQSQSHSITFFKHHALSVRPQSHSVAYFKHHALSVRPQSHSICDRLKL